MSTKSKRTDFSSICRTCMGTKTLISIFDGKENVNYYASVIFMVLGVKVVKGDGLPKNICKNCIKFINNSIEFRKKCQVIQTILLKAKNIDLLEKEQTDIKTIEKSPSDDLSDDETLIKYVNKQKKYKPLRKTNKIITKLNNINDNCFIKTEAIIDNTEMKYTEEINNIITEEDDVKINLHNDVDFKQNIITNGDHGHVFQIKEEMDHETNDRRSYNHNNIIIKHNTEKTHNEHVNTAYNCDNDIEYNHNNTENNINDFIYDHNDSGTNHNQKENNHNATKTNHNDSGYNCKYTGTKTNDSAYDESQNNHNNMKTSHYDTENNGSGNSTNGLTYNELETYHYESRNKHNNTETCHNDSEYNHNDIEQTNTTDKTHNDNDATAETHKKVKNNRVPCKICYKDLSFRSLDVHMSKCHPDLDERKTKCEFCSCYVIKNRMKRHVALHGDRFVCVHCMKEQTNIEALKIHAESCVQRIKKRSDNNSAKELKECDICNKVMQKGSLRLHKRLKHAGLGPVCEHCGKKLSNKFRLSEHLKAKHGYDKHKCSLCEFQTAFKVHLKNHERRHRGERPYVCEICGSKFHSQNQLIQHKYTHKDKEYKCDQCLSSFKTTVHLSVHKKTTHSTVSMCCGVCTRSFRCRHYLLKHMRNVHRITGQVALDNK